MPVRLFVGNLPYTVQEADIRQHFAAVGEPSRVLIPVDRETGATRGFAFVDFDDRAVAEAAIRALDGQQLNGRTLAVSEARPRGERPPSSGFQSGGFTSPGPDGAPGRPAGGAPKRAFGPDAPPRRFGKPRRYSTERPAKGPLRERSGGRVYDLDDLHDGAVDVDDDTPPGVGGPEPPEPDDTEE